MNWVVQFNEELRSINNDDPSAAEMKQWKKHSIYKIPACVAELNKKAYIPQLVSFGPYHFGQERLMPLESHKRRALRHFLKRYGKPLEAIVRCMEEVAHDLRDSYMPLDQSWKQDTQKFLQLMICDGCFMLEILRTADGVSSDYPGDDPVFGNHGKLYTVPYLKRDMLLLENQLPMLVLDILIGFEGNGIIQEEEVLSKRILKFFFPWTESKSLGKCLHVLEVYRKSLLRQEPIRSARQFEPLKMPRQEEDPIIRSAQELHEAGVGFRKSKTQSLNDVSFERGWLSLPTMVVDDTSESKFLNLIAFERLHVGAGNEISSYISFMDIIIDRETDVALLHQKGILFNNVGSDKNVAKLFNSLSRDITVDPNSPLGEVRERVSRYSKKRYNKWRANLCQTHFSNPWVAVSLVAAIIIFAFTVIQTYYTIEEYYQPPEDHGSRTAPKPPRFHRRP